MYRHTYSVSRAAFRAVWGDQRADSITLSAIKHQPVRCSFEHTVEARGPPFVQRLTEFLKNKPKHVGTLLGALLSIWINRKVGGFKYTPISFLLHLLRQLAINAAADVVMKPGYSPHILRGEFPQYVNAGRVIYDEELVRQASAPRFSLLWNRPVQQFRDAVQRLFFSLSSINQDRTAPEANMLFASSAHIASVKVYAANRAIVHPLGLYVPHSLVPELGGPPQLN